MNKKVKARFTTDKTIKGRKHKKYFLVKEKEESFLMTTLTNKTKIISNERLKKGFIEFVKNIDVKKIFF